MSAQSFTPKEWDKLVRDAANDLYVIAQRIDACLELAGCDAVENSLNPLKSLRFDAQKAIAKARGEVK